MSKFSLRGAVESALIVALVFGTGALARANGDDQTEGKVVRIGHSDGGQGQVNLPTDENSNDQAAVPHQQMPKYWIGLLGGAIGPDSPLRAQLDLPEKQGLIVANIVPDSPAAKAGLKQHDILLKANDKDLHEMQDLVELVLTQGPAKSQITLEILRHNKRETVQLTPEERPANAPVPQVGFNNGGEGGQVGLPNQLLQQFGGNLPMEFRNFGNGMIVGPNGAAVGGEAPVEVPNGVSVTVQKENGQPAHITVKRGSDTWNVVGDDPESLKQLPEDVRPYVEQLAHGGSGMQIHMPNLEHRLGQGLDDGQLRDRIDRMEKRLEEMQKHLSGSATDKSNDQSETKK